VDAAPASVSHLRRHIEDYPSTFDPALVTDIPAMRVMDDLFEGLVRLDPSGNTVPAVARRWSQSDDGRVWTFELRDDRRWSNGDAVTAHDFVFAWRRLVDPRTRSRNVQQVVPLAGALPIVRGEAAPDTLQVFARGDHVLEVRLEQRTPWFLYLLTNCFLMPLHRATLEAHGEQWTRVGNMVVNGAFRVTSTRINGASRLERNPHHPERGDIRLDAVTYFPIDDRGAASSRYLAGDLDVTDAFQLADIDWLRGRLRPGELRLAPYFGTVMLGFHGGRPPFDSQPLREALSLALDREVLTSKLLRGVYLPAWNVVAPLPGYSPAVPEWAQWSQERRLARARELYAEAGYSKKRPLRTELAYVVGDPDTTRTLEAVTAMWRTTLGADVQLAAEDFRVLLQNRAIGKHALFWNAWIGDYPDPLTFLDLLRRFSGQNFGKYSNDRFESLLDRALASPDDAGRMALYAQAEAELNADAINLPLYFYQSRHLVRPDVRGWQDNAMDRLATRNLWLDRGGTGAGG
jgi:oligopeptide transport system substrate-binding protein